MMMPMTNTVETLMSFRKAMAFGIRIFSVSCFTGSPRRRALAPYPDSNARQEVVCPRPKLSPPTARFMSGSIHNGCSVQ